MRGDLVLVSLGGVQRFISESRTTADVAGGSELVQVLARRAAGVAHAQLVAVSGPYGLIFPAGGGGDLLFGAVSNKIVFLAPAGVGAGVAQVVAGAVQLGWQELVEDAFGTAPVPATPGMPDVSWVSVTGSVDLDEYPELWRRGQVAMTGRRRGRVFPRLVEAGGSLCSVAAHLPASRVPGWGRQHEKKELLSAAGWVKRRVARKNADSGFPSTPAIASRVFRAGLRGVDGQPLLGAVLGRLANAVKRLDDREVSVDLGDRLGEWVYPDRWQALALAREYPDSNKGDNDFEAIAEAGRDAARQVVRIAGDAGVRSPTPYYAVVVQDLDRLGRALGELGLADQRRVSQQLMSLAVDQRGVAELDDHLAVPVYAGGDDFLAFCPAATALGLAAALRKLVEDRLADGPLGSAGPGGSTIAASTAVVFAHMSSPLQDTMAAARAAIEEAKSAQGADGVCRDALAVVVLRRGGERARTIQPWRPRHTADGVTAAELLAGVVPARESDQLSAGLAARLERDEAQLAELAGRSQLWATLRAELARLVTRQGGSAAAAEALWVLGMNERSGADQVFRPVPAALVARFLAQECR